MIRPDLAAAEIEERDETGAVADFHALRHSFITALAQGGVHPKTAQDLARHSDINLTMNTYTHTKLERRRDALVALPNLDEPASDAEAARATGTDDESVFAVCLAKQSLPKPIQPNQSRQLTEESDGREAKQKGPKTPVLSASGPSCFGEADGTRTRNPQIDSLVL